MLLQLALLGLVSAVKFRHDLLMWCLALASLAGESACKENKTSAKVSFVPRSYVSN